MVCPVGNDIVYMVRKLREGMAVSGHVPDGIKGATKRTVEIGGPMGLKWPAVVVFGAAGLIFAYAIVMASATHTGKLGKHLLPLPGA